MVKRKYDNGKRWKIHGWEGAPSYAENRVSEPEWGQEGIQAQGGTSTGCQSSHKMRRLSIHKMWLSERYQRLNRVSSASTQ